MGAPLEIEAGGTYSKYNSKGCPPQKPSQQVTAYLGSK